MTSCHMLGMAAKATSSGSSAIRNERLDSAQGNALCTTGHRVLSRSEWPRNLRMCPPARLALH
eukprot:15433333-Alexandrium_andersonii.AAC.1